MATTYRDNHIIYPDLFYIWTYFPPELCKNFFNHSSKNLYKKNICGIGFYSRIHARHVVENLASHKALRYIHIIKGSRLIEKYGITYLPFNKHLFHVFVNSPYSKYGDVKLKRWIYPQEFAIDKHRRRKFIVQMMRYYKHGRKEFDKKYSFHFNGYKPSFSKRFRYQMFDEAYFNKLKEYRKELGLPINGIRYDPELLYIHKQDLLNRGIHKEPHKRYRRLKFHDTTQYDNVP